MAPTTVKPWFSITLLLLAMASVSFGFNYWEEPHPKHHMCLKSCHVEANVDRILACRARCHLIINDDNETEPRRAKAREEQKQGEGRDEPEDPRRYHPEDPEERERERERQEREERQRQRRHQEEEREKEERERQPEKQKERERRHQKETEEEQKQRQQQERHRINPYFFNYHRRYKTRFQNNHGFIKVLQRFDQRPKLEGLRNFRIVEVETEPLTLIVPHHSDADYLIVVLEGKPLFTIAYLNNRESYNLEVGDVIRVPAGALAYAANRDNNQNLKMIKLALPLNIPGNFENFYPSGNGNPKSYYSAFSRRTLEATFNSQFEEIERVLFGEEEEQEERMRENEGGVIVKISEEQIRELSRYAKSSSQRGGKPSETGPINGRSLEPIYSNEHGNFWEARPEIFPPLRDLGIAITYLDLNKASVFVPHYNTKSIVIALVAQGEGKLEIACPHEANERSKEESEDEEKEHEEEGGSDEEEEENSEGQIRRLSSNLNTGDVFVIPMGHPFALRSSDNSDLKIIAFNLNAHNNIRNFLGGEKDNVINQIEREVKKLTFGGSGEEVERLFRNQKESYFVSAETHQSHPHSRPRQQEGILMKRSRNINKKSRVPLSSILGAFF